jgi:multiple sugar transport system permease protein
MYYINTVIREFKRFKMLFLTTLLLLLGLIILYPIIFTLADSFMADWEIEEYYGAEAEQTNISGSTEKYMDFRLIPYEATLRQYKTILIDRPQYLFMFWNSIKLALPTAVGQLIVAAMAAYAFSILKSRFAGVLYFIYLITMLLPFQVTLVPNYIIAQKLGIMGSCLSIILPGIFGTFGVFLLRQYMVSIPPSYMEAAKIDGAGHWNIFLKIVIPLLKSGLAALFILLFMDNWNMVEQPLIFLSNPLDEPLSLFLSNINNEEPGIAFAAAFIYMLPLILVFLYGEEYMVTGIGIQLSGIKG